MSIVEATKNMLDILPEADVRVIYSVTKNMFDRVSSPFKPLTREQILGDLAISRKQIENEEIIDCDDALNEIEVVYGLKSSND